MNELTENACKDLQIRDVVVFDLDHTISKRDTYLQFFIFFLRAHPFKLIRCLFLPIAVLLHMLHFRDNSWLKEKFLSAIAKGVRIDRINSFCQAFAEKTVQSGLYVSARARIDQHRSNNDYLILASASFDFYVIPIGRLLGFDDTICTQAEIDASKRLTGRISGNNCYGEYKKAATEKLIASRCRYGKLIVYSDHHSDLPIMSLATHAVAVNPSATLRKIASSSNMLIEYWR